MFCPKCGENIPDNVAFCGKCGNKIERNTSVPAAAPGMAMPPAPNAQTMVTPPTASQVAAVTTKPAKSGLSGIAIVALVLAIVAVVFALLPWFVSSSTLTGLGSAMSMLGGIGSGVTGRSYNLPSFDDQYSVFGFIGLAQSLGSYGGGSEATLLMITFVGWLIAMLILIIGIIIFAVTPRHNKVVLIIGAALLMAVCALWMFLYGAFTS